MNKLTPEAEAHIKANGYTKDLTVPAACILINGIERALTDTDLLKAQGLYTREEVRELIKAAVSIGGRNPGIETDADNVANTLLPLTTRKG